MTIWRIFLEDFKRMRCFQCGNALRIRSKRLKAKHPEYDAAKLHAHYYPTCEWVFQILGPKYVAQTLFDRKKSSSLFCFVFQRQNVRLSFFRSNRKSV